jgi:hypothetical protein
MKKNWPHPMKSFGNLVLMTLICIGVFIVFMATRPAPAQGFSGPPNCSTWDCRYSIQYQQRKQQPPKRITSEKVPLPRPNPLRSFARELPPYPPVVCVTPDWIPEPCAERKWGWEKGARITASRYYSNSDGCWDDCWIISIAGTIWVGDAAKFKRVVEENNITKAIVDLSSTGGAMLEALSIGYQVKDRGLSTRTVNLCTSACAFIWLAGRERNLIGSVGFHTVSVRDKDGILHADPSGNAVVRAYYKNLGISETASHWLTSPGPEEMLWVDAKLADDIGIEINMPQPRPPAMTVATPKPPSLSHVATRAVKCLLSDGAEAWCTPNGILLQKIPSEQK